MARFVVWINNIACPCQSLAAAERIVNSLKRRGRETFICGSHLWPTIDAPDARATTSPDPKRKIGRLLYFRAIQRPQKRAS